MTVSRGGFISGRTDLHFVRALGLLRDSLLGLRLGSEYWHTGAVVCVQLVDGVRVAAR